MLYLVLTDVDGKTIHVVERPPPSSSSGIPAEQRSNRPEQQQFPIPAALAGAGHTVGGSLFMGPFEVTENADINNITVSRHILTVL